MGGQESEASHPLSCQVFRFALASSFLAIVSAGSTIEYKYDKIKGCEQSREERTGTCSQSFSYPCVLSSAKSFFRYQLPMEEVLSSLPNKTLFILLEETKTIKL